MIILVGAFNPSEQYSFVSWDDFRNPISEKKMIKIDGNIWQPNTTKQMKIGMFNY